MKRVLSLVLAIAMCVSTFSIVKADELTDAQKEYKEVQDSINENKKELNQINQQKASTEKAVEELDKKMDQAANKLAEIKGNIRNVDKEIKDQEKQIKETEEAIEEGNELFKKRVRAMYINGSESYLEILLGSNSFSDFVSRIDVVSKLMQYDKGVITDMEHKSEELKQAKASLESKKKSMLALKSAADNQYKTLEADSDKKKDYMTKLEGQQSEYLKLIEQEEQESKAIASMIQKIKKRKEEEAKRKAQENNRGGSVLTSTDASIGKLFCVTGQPYRITSPFGMRKHPVLNIMRMHKGIDIGVSSGTPLYSLADGVVIYSGTMSGYGKVIMIDHGNLTSLYAHNSSLGVSEGQAVKGGQLIAYSGNTGLSSGPHLHFEIRNSNGEAINPINYYVR